MAGKKEFDECNFTGAQELMQPTNESASFSFGMENVTLYFACSMPNHCTNGQKVEIVWQPRNCGGYAQCQPLCTAECISQADGAAWPSLSLKLLVAVLACALGVVAL